MSRRRAASLPRDGAPLRERASSSPSTRCRALLDLEKDLNDKIAHATGAFTAGAKMPETVRILNAGERGLRAVEAAAASRKILIAERDHIVEQLNYLVQVQQSGAADTASAVSRAAREAVETKLEKDAALQQATIAAATRALKDGASVPSDDLIAPLYADALKAAKAAFAARTSEMPLRSAHQIDVFTKRFGYSDTAVTAVALERASKDKAALAVLTGKAGGKPAVGTPFVLKAPILYVK